MRNFGLLRVWICVMMMVGSGVVGPSLFARKAAGVDADKGRSIDNAEWIVGKWVAEIDMPQAELKILMELNMKDRGNCTVKCKWSAPYESRKDSGKAKYRLCGNQLTITFLNDDEVIKTDHIFDLENVYDIRLEKNELVILNNRQFRNVDIHFGRGYKKRGFSEIIFPE